MNKLDNAQRITVRACHKCEGCGCLIDEGDAAYAWSVTTRYRAVKLYAHVPCFDRAIKPNPAYA